MSIILEHWQPLIVFFLMGFLTGIIALRRERLEAQRAREAEKQQQERDINNIGKKVEAVRVGHEALEGRVSRLEDQNDARRRRRP